MAPRKPLVVAAEMRRRCGNSTPQRSLPTSPTPASQSSLATPTPALDPQKPFPSGKPILPRSNSPPTHPHYGCAPWSARLFPGLSCFVRWHHQVPEARFSKSLAPTPPPGCRRRKRCFFQAFNWVCGVPYLSRQACGPRQLPKTLQLCCADDKQHPPAVPRRPRESWPGAVLLTHSVCSSGAGQVRVAHLSRLARMGKTVKPASAEWPWFQWEVHC